MLTACLSMIVAVKQVMKTLALTFELCYLLHFVREKVQVKT